MRGKKFDSVISLGDFCGPAQEIERIGYRNSSFPFDWLITKDFSKVMRLIETHFENFLEFDNLCQEVDVNPKYYYDGVNDIHFYHDFCSTEPLQNQLSKVVSKYRRRVERFYNQITKPTLFIRYCQTISDIDYINTNKEFIQSFFKQFNPNNELIFVTHQDVRWGWLIAENEQDIVAKHIFYSLPELKKYVMDNVQISPRKRLSNLARYYRKKVKKSLLRHFNS